ncbi:MAG: molybdopterin-dependent oxidoreductase [Deltaproteobacteria bacterium]|nr:molybdopterin-dependent oxidoreductase [Deltaproteobacteria bacterium]
MLNRRDFLKLVGVGGAGAAAGFALGEKSKNPSAELIPYLVPPEDIIPGVANWYTSVCAQCSAGCGIIVRVMEGRAKKIEGNPLHPINKGKLCARGQASLQALYNPDRIKNPLKRKGERGKGEFQEITWEQGIAMLSENLSSLRNNKRETEKLYLLTSSIRGHLNSFLENFIKAYGSSNYLQYELFQHENLLLANNIAFGQDTLPYYDIENTKFLLSLGADFLNTWVSPVNYSQGYGHMRQGRPGIRGKVVQIEPRLSLTGANADEWVPIKPGTEGLLALGMAYAILEQGYYKGRDAQEWKNILNKYHPKDVAVLTEVDERRIRALAKEFAVNKPSLAIGGENVASYENGASQLIAVNILNHLAGNIGKNGGVISNPKGASLSNRRGAIKKITAFAKDASNGKIKTLILYNANPVFTTPKTMKIEDAINNIPFIVSLSGSMDESTAMADLILPTHTPLEDWGDDFAEPSVGYSIATVMQPAVSPVFNTRNAGDIFIDVAEKIGGAIKKEVPWNSFDAFLKDSWKKIYDKNKGIVIQETTFDEFWDNLLAKGWWRLPDISSLKPGHISTKGINVYLQKEPSKFDGDDKNYPFYLCLYPHSGYLDGRGANLPWLQEMPDPMTSVVWGVWVEMNPKTAQGMGIKNGDMVSVESPYGNINIPAYLYPGIRPDTVSIPIGQGHRLYGRYAADRGVNPIEILPFKVDPRSGAIPLNSTRVKITARRDAPGNMVKMEGSTREFGRKIVETVTPDEFSKMGMEG